MGGADQYRCKAVRIHQRGKLPVPRARGRIPRCSPPQRGDTIIVLEVSHLARSTHQLCEIIERVWEKRLWLVIVGSITLDCREGKADPMSRLSYRWRGIQPVGIGDDTKPCAVWDGKRQGQGQADWQAANNPRQHSRNLPSALPRLQKRAVEYFRIGKSL